MSGGRGGVGREINGQGSIPDRTETKRIKKKEPVLFAEAMELHWTVRNGAARRIKLAANRVNS